MQEQVTTTMTANPQELRVDLDKNEFALALKTYRLRAGLTQQQLGEQWGVSRYTIMRAEAGRDITWTTAYRLFAHLSKALRQEGGEQ